MSADILKFPAPQYKGTQPPVKSKPKDDPRYWCMSCQSDLFRNYEDGKICCGNCGSLIRNIVVLTLV